MTVENLEIKVSAKGVTAAENRFNSLADAMERVGAAGGAISGGGNGGSINSTAKAVKNVGEAAKKANKPLGNFISSLKRIAFYRVIRSIIKSITQAFSEGLEWAYQFSAGIAKTAEDNGHRFSEAMDLMKTAGTTMKSQLGSAFIGLLAAISPVVIQIINLVTRLADALSQLFAAFTGKTYLKAASVPQKWADSAKKAGGAAKEWKNQLMGFDEINRLNEPSGGGGGGAAGIDPSQLFTDAPLEDWAQKIHDNLALIETVAAGFALGIGLILLFSGANIPLGLGLTILGAAGLVHAVSENWGSVDAKLASCLHNIMVVAGISMLGIGLVLAFSGANLPLGLGLVIAGAASLVTAAAVRWGLDKEIGNQLTKITQVVSWGMFAIGAVLALTGNLPVGLGIMGASLFAMSTTINWNALLDGITETWGKIKLFYDEHIKKFFTREYWQGLVNDMLSFTWPHIPLPHFSVTWQDAGPLASFFGFSSVPSISVSFYAKGGFPEMGELFFASEQGPELVGQMGGRNAVANQQEITDGIRQGVYDAMMAANGNGKESVVRVYLDGKQITNAVTRNQRNTERSTGVSYA